MTIIITISYSLSSPRPYFIIYLPPEEVSSLLNKSTPLPIYRQPATPHWPKKKFNIRRVSRSTDEGTATSQLHCPPITFPGEI